MARKHNHLKRLSNKFSDASKLKKTKLFDNSVGVRYEKPTNIQQVKVDGVITTRQRIKGKQKVYRTSKPLI